MKSLLSVFFVSSRLTQWNLFVLLALLGLFPLTVQAQNSQDFGQFVVHFNAIKTDFLQEAVAKQYQINRAKDRGLVNIAVLKKVMSMPSQPTPAQIEGSAVTLSKQLRNLDIKEIKDGNAIYYLTEFKIGDGETLDFTFNVKPEGDSEAYTVKFRHTFYH